MCDEASANATSRGGRSRPLTLGPFVSGLILALAFAARSAFATDGEWVTTWGCAPQLTEPGNRPPVPLANSTLRQFVHTSIGGKQVRVRFSNAYGTDSVTIAAARIALSAAAGSGGDGDIDPATDQALTFDGAPGAVIPPGQTRYSDPLTFALPALTNVALSVCFGSISATTLNGHPGSRTTSFIVASNAVSAPSLPQAAKTAHWYIITGLEVLAEKPGRAVVVLGDSLTDGRGSTTDGNNRWPDGLARRLQTNAPTAAVAVVNMGIGGNAIYGGLGPAAVKRFDRDVLEQRGARYVIVFEGVNDIGGDSSGTVATNLIAAYTRFITHAHARNLLAYGATLTPFGGSGYYSVSHEGSRQTVNTWFRTNHLYDGVIDFDAAVRDPAAPARLHPNYDSGDHLHLSPAGYQAMADAIDLNLMAR